jgi:hypothetical protein
VGILTLQHNGIEGGRRACYAIKSARKRSAVPGRLRFRLFPHHGAVRTPTVTAMPFSSPLFDLANRRSALRLILFAFMAVVVTFTCSATAQEPGACPSLAGDARDDCFRSELERQARLPALAPSNASSDQPPPAHCPSLNASAQPACYQAEIARQSSATVREPGESAPLPRHCPSLLAAEREDCYRVEALRQRERTPPRPTEESDDPPNCPNAAEAARAACYGAVLSRQQTASLPALPPLVEPPANCPSLAEPARTSCFAEAQVR